MIELGLGLTAIAAAALLASGLLDGSIPFPIGSGLLVAIAIAGFALVLHALYRRRLKAGEPLHRIRSLGLATVVAGAAVLIALFAPSLSEPLNLVSAGGFPIGFYLMAQGALVVFVVLLFVFAVRQGRIDDADEV